MLNLDKFIIIEKKNGFYNMTTKKILVIKNKVNNKTNYSTLDFSYHIKDTVNLLNLLEENLLENKFESEYGFKDIFIYDPIENTLIKQYNRYNKKEKDTKKYKQIIQLDDSLKEDIKEALIKNYEEHYGNSNSTKETNSAKGSKQLDNVESDNQQQPDIQQQEKSIDYMDTEIESEEASIKGQLESFMTFKNDLPGLHIYLTRFSNMEGQKFIKWLEDIKNLNLNLILQCWPIDKLEELRKEFYHLN